MWQARQQQVLVQPCASLAAAAALRECENLPSMLSHGVPHYLSLGFHAWPHSPMRVPTVTQACTLATTWMQPAGQAWGGELQGGGRGLLKGVAAQA